ncbi:hypothetical protein [Acinetobacter haemolyticus]|uniref:hypothetical protein n=1 Tax=Acinetobacter haemolyticus TaxID=29430 RepID=UPI000D68F431|nr:hypothetical protein [Acinetobacter haemolyticus]
MSASLTQIRSALQELAIKKGRPAYELYTAKQVKHALDNGLEHNLLAELPFFEVVKEKDEPLRDVVQREYPTAAQAKEIQVWLKNFKGRYIDLAEMVGCNASSFQHIKAGRVNCTLDMYKRIMKARKQLEGVAA